MPTYVSHDPRKDIRSTIGTTWWTKAEGDLYTINILDNDNRTVRVPMYTSEELDTEDIKEMPYIEMELAYCHYEPGDVGARTRDAEAYIDFMVCFADTDNIDSTSFGKKILDEIINQIRTHQIACTFPVTITFINLEDIRPLKETKAHQVVFKYVATIYVLFYDLC